MSERIHCDADGCDASYDGNEFVEPVAPGWRTVHYISAAQFFETDAAVKHFSSMACLARWASEQALHEQIRRAKVGNR